MDTFIVTVPDTADRRRVAQALHDIEGATVRALPPVDEATQLSQTTLADEWDSDEDQRWDELL
jgi:hypothetical protein